jgi:FlaA1/EpsC-like NDP-sugar epimerase
MGEPVSIVSLAKKMIRLSGLVLKDEINPDGDSEIEYTGLRPGEKLYEELLIGDNTFSTDNALIMRAREDMVSWEKLKPVLDDLNKVVESCDQEKIRMLLLKLVPDFKPQCEIKDILYKKI